MRKLRHRELIELMQCAQNPRACQCKSLSSSSLSLPPEAVPLTTVFILDLALLLPSCLL